MKTRARLPRRLLFALLLFAVLPAQAEELIMLRVRQPFPEAMASLQESIKATGYTVARVQRVDVGLTGSGFQTAEYRVVFFGKPEEIHRLPARYPDLIPFLPLQITIFAEGTDTLLLTYNPASLAALFKHAELRPTFTRWEKDIRSIFDRVQAQ